MKENSIMTMTAREIKVGDIVRVKPEWLDPNEDGSTCYVVLEEAGVNRVLVQALGTGLALAPTYIYAVEWLSYAGSALAEVEHA